MLADKLKAMQLNAHRSSRRTKTILAVMKVTHAIFLAVLVILVLCFAASMLGVGGEAVRAIFPVTITVIICTAVVTVLLRFALTWSKRGDSR